MLLARVTVRVCAIHKVCFVSWSWLARRKAIKEEDGASVVARLVKRSSNGSSLIAAGFNDRRGAAFDWRTFGCDHTRESSIREHDGIHHQLSFHSWYSLEKSR